MQLTDFIEHPEGGRYREVFRSDAGVVADDGRSRSTLSHIYFSLEPGEVSLFHKVASDEVWNLYSGAGLLLCLWDGSANPPTTIELSARAGHFCHVVPAGCWQAARPLSDSVLVGCSVAPAFAFADFELIDARSDVARRILAMNPEMQQFIGPARDA